MYRAVRMQVCGSSLGRLTVCYSQAEDQHLIMERRRDVCPQCQAEGRGRGQHPGSHGANGSQNGSNGAIDYKHVGVLSSGGITDYDFV
ncbi:hypothetical protein OH77DRAFT_1421337 [Trametes cingulata]|nr:hypothetical protein OH77DRAFT_1421337 [Trametes cingulata]